MKTKGHNTITKTYTKMKINTENIKQLIQNNKYIIKKIIIKQYKTNTKIKRKIIFVDNKKKKQ